MTRCTHILQIFTYPRSVYPKKIKAGDALLFLIHLLYEPNLVDDEIAVDI
jgi:hypothetical protein